MNDNRQVTVCATPLIQAGADTSGLFGPAKFPPPRPNTADQACDDLIEFLVVRNREPSVAQAYEDFLKSGLPIFTCEIDRDATAIAGKARGLYKLQECLMRHVLAFRANQRVDA